MQTALRWYYRKLADGLIVLHSQPHLPDQLEELQRICFPTLADAERFKAAHYLKHIQLFDAGQFVALDGGAVIGLAATTLRLDFDFDHIDHTFAEVIQGRMADFAQPGRRMALRGRYQRSSEIPGSRNCDRDLRRAAGSSVEIRAQEDR